MQKKFILAISILLLPLLSLNDLKAYEGNGTENTPYIISSESDVKKLRDDVNNGEKFSGKYFILKNNIVLSGSDWIPIGNNSGKSFQGNLDGYGYTISGLQVTKLYNNWAGLFGSLSGKVSNLNVEGNVLIGSSTAYMAATNSVRIGGVAAVVEATGSLVNCSTNISVQSYVTNSTVNYVHIGSIAGANYGIIKNCNGAGTVDSYFEVTYANSERNWNLCAHNVIGGVVGQNNNKVEACNSTTSKVFGDIKSKNTGASVYLGGIVGQMDQGNIHNCYGATLDLKGNTQYHSSSNEHALRVGGIVGSTYGGTITSCSTAYDKIKGDGGGAVSNSTANVKKFVLMYLSNGGTGSMDNSNLSLLSTDEHTVLANGYNLNNIGFSKWNSKANGTGKDYFPGDKIKLTENLNLYAIWKNTEQPKYNITLDTNGGTPVTLEPNSIIQQSPVSTKEGYTLEGWYTSSDFKDGTKITFPFQLENDTTLYAKFVPNESEPAGSSILWVILTIIFLFIIIFIVLYVLWKKKDKKPLPFLVPVFRRVNKWFFKTTLNDLEKKEQNDKEHKK